MIWNLDSLAQLPYYGAEARHRIDCVVKKGRVFADPAAPLAAMHARAHARRGARGTPCPYFAYKTLKYQDTLHIKH